MNERIKQLAEQASGEFCKQNPYATIMLPAPLREKFAELIVKDVCKIVKGQKIVEPLGGYQDWENGYNASVKHAVEQIKRQYEKV